MAGFTGANGQSYTTAAYAAASINRANASAAIAQPKAPTTPAPAPAPALQTSPKAPATPTQAVSNANSTAAQPVTNQTAQNAINVSRQTQGQTTPGGVAQTPNQLLNAGANTGGANQGAATTTQATTPAANTTPWLDSTGMPSKSYVPTDDTDPVFLKISDPVTAAYYKMALSNKLGLTHIDLSTMPFTTDDQTKMQSDQATEKQTYMDTQIDQSIQSSRTATAQSQSAVNATIGNVNREGATSAGNTQTAQQIVSKYGTDQSQLEAQYAQQKLELQQATDNGLQDQANQAAKALQATQQQLLTTANSQLTDAKNLVDSLSKSGGLTGMSDTDLMDMSQQYGISFPVLKAMATQANVAAQTQTQKDQATATTSAIDTFVTLNTAGVTLTPDMVQSTAKQMGVDPTLLQGAASGFNQQVANINADKTLDAQTKQTALAQAQSDLQDQLNGFAGKAGQDIKGLVNLYNSGASADIISAYKQTAGITDYNDPMTQATLAMQNAQTDDERAKAYTDAVDAGLNPGAVIPTGGTYSMTVDASGKCQVDPPDGTYLGPGASNECGGYVNQVFGAKVMPSSYEGKLATCDKSVGFGAGQTPPTPGMAFVMNVPGSSYGHTGIFLGVDPNKPGMATVKDSNYNDKTEPNVVQTHDIPLSEIKGYTPPPNATTSGGNASNMSDQAILKAADANGTTLKTPTEQNEYIAAVRRAGFIPGQAKGQTVKDTSTPIPGIDLSLDELTNNQSSDGTKYLTTDDLSDYTGASKSAIASAAHACGRKILNATDSTTMKNISESMDDINQLDSALQKVQAVDPGLIQKGMALASQDLATAAQTDPNLAALQEYKMIAAKVSTTLSGIKGMRNATLINQAAEDLPSPTEPRADQEAKINAIENMFKQNEKDILGTSNKAAAQSTGNSGGGIFGNFLSKLVGGASSSGGNKYSSLVGNDYSKHPAYSSF